MDLFIIKRFVVPDPSKSSVLVRVGIAFIFCMSMEFWKIQRFDRNFSNEPHSFVYVRSPLMRRGWGKLEPNSYIRYYRMSAIEIPGEFYICVLIRPFTLLLKLLKPPDKPYSQEKPWTRIEELASPMSQYFIVASLDRTSFLVYPDNR